MDNNLHFSSKKDDWRTPRWLFDLLNEKYCFTIDLFASPENALCDKYLTNCFEQQGLITNNDFGFGNPPYKRTKPNTWDFVGWASNYRCALLLPARTDTKGFHKYCVPPKAGWHLIEGRLFFLDDNGNEHEDAAPFASMIVVFNDKTGILETINANKRGWK